MKRFTSVLLFFLFASFHVLAEAKDSCTSIEDFLATTLYIHDIKSSTSMLNMYIVRHGGVPPYSAVDDLLEMTNEDFLTAKTSVADNEKLAGLLQDYYAFWTASMEKIKPGRDESEEAFETRIKKDEKILLEMSGRIRSEMKL